jgi:hypothetical protein
MRRKRDVAIEELSNLTGDLRSLVTTLTSDPQEQARKERNWRILYGGLSAVSALLARRLATKSWGILTGEKPPGKSKAKKA